MNDLTPQEEKKLKRLQKIVDSGELGIVEEIDNLDNKIETIEEKVDVAIVNVQSDVEEIRVIAETASKKEGPQGIQGEKGEKGEKGDEGKSGRDGLNGINGVDGRDGLNGKDGIDGTDGKDGSPDTGKEIIVKINKDNTTLINFDKVENLKEEFTKLGKHIDVIGSRDLMLNTGGLLEVSHGTSLTGTGTQSNPLNVSSSYPTGSGTANQVTYWNGTSSIAGSNEFFFDGTDVGIGTTTPRGKFDIYKSSSIETIGDVTSATGSTFTYNYNPSAKKVATGNTVTWLIYAYKDIPESGIRVYSSTPLTVTGTDNNSGNNYSINKSWTAVSGASGYKIVVTADSEMVSPPAPQAATTTATFDTYGATIAPTDFIIANYSNITVTPTSSAITTYDTYIDDTDGSLNHGTDGHSKNFNLNGDFTQTGAASITGATNIVGTVGITGATTITGDTLINGEAIFYSEVWLDSQTAGSILYTDEFNRIATHTGLTFSGTDLWSVNGLSVSDSSKIILDKDIASDSWITADGDNTYGCGAGAVALSSRIGQFCFINDSDSTSAVLTAGAFVYAGGTSSQFLKADGSVDSTSYQPLDATLTSLAAVSGVQGDLLYASGTDTWAKLAKNTTATRYLSNTGTSNNPAWAQINMANGVTGTLPVGNGGTGATTFTNNRVLTGNGTSAIVDEANFTFNGSLGNITGQLIINSGNTLNQALEVTGSNFSRFAVTNTNVSPAGGEYAISSFSVQALITAPNTYHYTQFAAYGNGTGNGSRWGVPLNAISELLAVNGDLAIGTYGNNTLYLGVGSTEYMRIASDGKIGIGNKAPSVGLEISSATAVGSGADYPYSNAFTTTYPNVVPGSIIGYDSYSYPITDDGAGNISGYGGTIAQINYTTGVVTDDAGSPATINYIYYSYTYAVAPTDFLKINSNLVMANGGTVRLSVLTVATLPAGVQGDTAMVTDALAPAFGVAVAGGGAVVTKVFYDGANWIVG